MIERHGTQLGLHADTDTVSKLDHFFCHGEVLREGKARTVEHHRAEARLNGLVDDIDRFAVIEVQHHGDCRPAGKLVHHGGDDPDIGHLDVLFPEGENHGTAQIVGRPSTPALIVSRL